MNEVLFEQRGRVAIVTLNRPESLNAFTTALRARLKETLLRVADDPSIRAVVLTGAGRGFSAGADLKDEPLIDGADVERQSRKSTALRTRHRDDAQAGHRCGQRLCYRNRRLVRWSAISS
jgi:enoyl-CoA hydratase/carnithine racemase